MNDRPREEVFHDYPAYRTSAEVWAVIHARHKEQLKVFGSFSDPTGTSFGGPGMEGRMETTYGLKGADYPLLGARTIWDILEGRPSSEMNEYFLIIAKKDSYS